MGHFRYGLERLLKTIFLKEFKKVDFGPFSLRSPLRVPFWRAYRMIRGRFLTIFYTVFVTGCIFVSLLTNPGQEEVEFGPFSSRVGTSSQISRSVRKALAAGPCGSGEWLGTKRGVVGDGKGRSWRPGALKCGYSLPFQSPSTPLWVPNHSPEPQGPAARAL